MPEPIPCRHVHIEGRQCGSPALRGQKLCYHHNAAFRPLTRRPGDPRGPLLPDPEDLPAVQRGLAELLRLVARDLIEAKQAKLLFALLAEAGTNLARLDRAHARRRHLALSEARFAAKYPEAAARLAAENAQHFVLDLVHDPDLGPLAPAPDAAPEPDAAPDAETSPETLYESSGPDLLPAFARDSPGDEYARILRDRAADAEQAEFERGEEENRERRRALRVAALDCQPRPQTPLTDRHQEKSNPSATPRTASPIQEDHLLTLVEC